MIHATWNLLGKRSSSSLVFFVIAAAPHAVVFLPLLIAYRDIVVANPLRGWMLLTGAALSQAVYYFGLHHSYRSGELSVAYPLLRALPVLLILLVNLTAGRRTQIGAPAIVGMVVLVAGCIILPLRRFAVREIKRYLSGWAAFAVLAAVGTAGYTIIDDEALRLLRGLDGIARSPAEISACYVILEMLVGCAFLAIIAFATPAERAQLRTIRPRLVAQASLAGVMICVTYGMVLTAMAFVRSVSYVAAFRQLSIPIGAALGILIQGERPSPPKLLGVAMISAGLVLVALG